jgi:peptidoglycan/xylan/chitin deacetylase (PgdA/CDA1 family)
VNLPGAKTLRRIGSRWRGRLLGGAVILGYHRVTGDRPDLWAPGVERGRFREQMEVLRREFTATPLEAVHGMPSAPGRNGRGLPVAVTFDDGYRDIVEHAVPVLEELEIPATVFVITGMLGRTAWWDRLAGLLRRPAAAAEDICFEVGGRPFQWSAGKSEAELLAGAHRHLRWVHAEERESVLAQLESRWGAPLRPAPSLLGEADLVALGERPLVEIGSHTVTHPDLTTLSPAKAASELRRSRAHLESLLASPVTSFSYPHGLAREGLRSLVADAGYLRACASGGGLVSKGSDPFLLPRLWPGDLPGPAFRRWLGSWTGR